jgi:hypothetical protein
MAQIEPPSLTDQIYENEVVFNVISVLSLIPVVVALLLWALARFFRGAATSLLPNTHE